MNTDPVFVIQTQVEAYNRRDLEGFLACYHPDAVLANLKTGAVTARGHAELRPIYTKRFESPALHAEIAKRMALGDMVIDFEQITGMNGAQGITEVIMVYQVTAGLIARAWAIRKE